MGSIAGANGAKRFDVAIVGGGAVGAACAYYLARAGARVCLVERRDLASGASGANAGFVFYQTHGPGWAFHAAMATRRLFEVLARELPVDIEYRASGGMIVGFEPEQLPLVRAYAERQTEIGHAVRFVDGDAARERAPVLGANICGAAYSPDDASVNPMLLTLALGEAAKSSGAVIRTGVAVMGLLQQGGRVTGVETDDGPIGAGWVVNAAGARSPEIAALAGIRLPVHPRRVQMAITERVHPVIEGDVICGRRIVKSAALLRECQRRAFPDREPDAPLGHDTHAGMGHMLLVRQTPSGPILLGESMDQRVFQGGVDLAGLRKSLAHVHRLMPGLRDVGIMRVWNGTLGDGPDGLPLIGEWSSMRGLVMATGHGGVGIIQAPITGLLVSQIITGAPPEVSLGPVRPDRYNSHARGE